MTAAARAAEDEAQAEGVSGQWGPSEGARMRWPGAVVMILVGAAVCGWTVISRSMAWEGYGPHTVPRFFMGLGWTLAGIVVLILRPPPKGPRA